MGNWKNDMMNGEGTFTDNKGHRYSGNWLNSKRSGKGTYTYAGNKKEILKNPEYLFLNGIRYVGNGKKINFMEWVHSNI